MKLPQLQRTSGSGEARAGPHLWRLLIGFRLDNLGIASKSPWAPTNNFLWVEPLESPPCCEPVFWFRDDEWEICILEAGDPASISARPGKYM